jgi:hypothetical protein
LLLAVPGTGNQEREQNEDGNDSLHNGSSCDNGVMNSALSPMPTPQHHFLL